MNGDGARWVGAASGPLRSFWERQRPNMIRLQPFRRWNAPKVGGVELVGDTSCRWGSPTGNRAVHDVRRAFGAIGADYRFAGRMRFDGYAYPTPGYLLHRISSGSYEHVQSIGRLAGIGDNEFVVFTHSTASAAPRKEGALAVVRMGANRTSGGHPFGGMPHGDGPDPDWQNRTVLRTRTGNNHPGGLAVLGHHVFVAQWCQPHPSPWHLWCQESAGEQGGTHGMGFSVYDAGRVSLGVAPEHVHYEHVFGQEWIGDSSVASVAAARLASGQVLVALGRSGGKTYGFYVSDDWKGPYRFIGSASPGYWGENAAIVTERGTGSLYLFQMEGYGMWDSIDMAHLYRIDASGGQIVFRPVTSRKFRCRGGRIDGAGDWAHFDAGAGMYVTPAGRLVLYATEWQQSDAGNIRVVEFS